MRKLLWVAAALLTVALLAGVVVASIDHHRNGPVPTEHGDPGDPSAYPQVSVGVPAPAGG